MLTKDNDDGMSKRVQRLELQIAAQQKEIESLSNAIKELSLVSHGNNSLKDEIRSKNTLNGGEIKFHDNIIKDVKTVNDAGFCVGEQVKIMFDRSGNIFNPKNRKKRTSIEGKTGTITKLTKCFVWIDVFDNGELMTVKKSNHNVRRV